MKTLHRAAFWFLLLCFAGAMAGWVLYVPYRADRLFDAIPAHAIMVSGHERVAARWQELGRLSIVRAAALGTGVTEREYDAALTNRALTGWVRRLGQRRTVAAYAPARGARGMDAWMLSTWIGAEGRPLRWAQGLGLLKGVSARTSRTGLCHYIVKTKPDRAGHVLGVAIEDGIAMLCWSADPDGVEMMQESLRDRRPGRWSRDPALVADAPADRGTINLPFPQRPRFLLSPLRWSLPTVEAERVRVDMTGRVALGPAPPLSAAGDTTVLSRLLQDAPHAMAACPLGYIQALLPRQAAAAFSNLLLSAAGNAPAGMRSMPLYAAVLGDEFSGRVGRDMVYFLGVGLKVPTLVLAAPVATEARGAAIEAGMLDHLNRTYRAGLIRKTEPVGVHVLTHVVGTANDFYGKLAADEECAYVFCDGWLILCSNAAVLKSLLTRYDKGPSGERVPLFGNPAQAPATPAAACVRLDFRKLKHSLKAGLALYKFFIPRNEEGDRRREVLDQLERGLNVMASLRTSTLWVGETGEFTSATLQVGDGATVVP